MSSRTLSYFGLFCMLLVGCGLTEGVVQKDQRSFLWFTGDTDNAIVQIDDLEPIELDKPYVTVMKDGEWHRKEKSEKIHYEISPGKHRIIVKKAGQVVVERIVLLGNGAIKEIKIP